MRKLMLVMLVMSVVGAAGCGDLEVDYGDTANSKNTGLQTSLPPADSLNNDNVTATNNATNGSANNTTTNGSTNNTQPPVDEPPVLMCTAPETVCGEACVNTTSNPAHCGGCDQACPAGTMCAASECVCSGGDELCGGACVDTALSNQHCGGCNMACGGGQLCVNGDCIESTNVAGILQATNAFRASGADCGQYGVKAPAPPLSGDPELHIAAQVHADDMDVNDFFSHTGSDGSSFVVRIGRTNFSGQPIGENIAGGGSQPAGVVQRWVDSDGHCRNLMNPDATKIGIGYSAGGPYGTSWVQVFGR